MTSPRWVFVPDPGEIADNLAAALGISLVTARILCRRLPSPDLKSARAFLQPSLADLYSPWDMRDMDKAADRLAKAVRDKERILVYGDYDADGVTATAILLQIFQALGHPADYHIPSRIEEGYGISKQFVDEVLQDKVDVIVTVDCGLSNIEEIGVLVENGIDVIVTDHHEPGDQALPPAMAVVNPKRTDASYGFRELVGAGVAFKLGWALCERIAGAPRVGSKLQETLLSVLPIATIGTIADVAPLMEENRILVVHGLQAMRHSNAGVRALLEIANVNKGPVSPRDVAFTIAPRLNAAGRMGDAELALQCLMAENEADATRLARELDTKNTERQQLCQLIHEKAHAECMRPENVDAPALVVAHEDWHEGVSGIVASRLVDEFEKPVAVIALRPDSTTGKGSARSVKGVNLYEAISKSRDLLLSYGGHELAAGFSIARENIEAFREAFSRHCRQQVVSKKIEPELLIEDEIELGSIHGNLAREMEMLAPFGAGNARPYFLLRQVRVVGRPQLLGNSGKHFAFNASQKGVAYRAVVFNHPEWLEVIDRGALHWDVVFNFSFNDYYSPPRMELHVEDMRPC